MDEKLIKCTKCGRFMSVNYWIGENSDEHEEYICSCGVVEKY